MNIKRLLNKKSWTGKELGILEVAAAAYVFKEARAGNHEAKPLVTPEQLSTMLNSITTPQQGHIYNGYLAIHRWIAAKFQIAQTQRQEAQLNFNIILNYVTGSEQAENIYKYLEALPLIMTEKEYNEYREKRQEASYKDENGEELYLNVFNLVERYISYWAEQLRADPDAKNPLKAIKAKYEKQPIKSKIIKSHIDEFLGRGYYTLADGRRSDQMTDAEWQEAIAEPDKEKQAKLKKELSLLEAELLFKGASPEEAEAAVDEYEASHTTATEWHLYEKQDTITKWDIIDEAFLLDFYPADLSNGDIIPAYLCDNDNNWNDDNFTASMLDFVAEFKELVTRALKEIDRRFIKNKKLTPLPIAADQPAPDSLSTLPIEKWATTLYSWRDLDEVDFYSLDKPDDLDLKYFDGNRRAIMNGIAIVKPTLHGYSSCIDRETGYYIEPDAADLFTSLSLVDLLSESENYALATSLLEKAYRQLKDAIYYVQGYNKSIKLIAKSFEIPYFEEAFSVDISPVISGISDLNALTALFYKRVYKTQYTDNALKQRKLEAIQDNFELIDPAKLIPTPEQMDAAADLLADFKAFKDEAAQVQFDTLTCFKPAGEGEYSE